VAPSASRVFWIAFGVANHALLAVTVWSVFWFLKGHDSAPRGGSLALDAALALQFGLLHSALLLPAVRTRLSRWIPWHSYGCFFCAATCVSLLTVICLWNPISPIVWSFEGAARTAVETAYYLSWAFLFYALWLSGIGYQSGFTPWWDWVRGREAPKRRFRPRGAFYVLRHPVYLAFLGLIWSTPTVTLDRAVLIGLWTAYVFVGSALKDRRLTYYLGDEYRKYSARVPGYPGMPFGPLARTRPGARPRELAQPLAHACAESR
jgi:protein-S-isoprenylcysteine O-methyltransferase Ste14